MSPPSYLFVCLFTGSHCVSLAGLEFSLQASLALNLQRSPHFCLPRAEIKGMHTTLGSKFMEALIEPEAHPSDKAVWPMISEELPMRPSPPSPHLGLGVLTLA